jgi:flagellar protein FliO/FliZ
VAELAVRVVVSLGVVLGLFWMVARLGSRKIGGRDRSLLRVRSRQALSRGSSLAVVEVGSRVLVVGVSDGGVRLLTELDPFELETTPGPAAGSSTGDDPEGTSDTGLVDGDLVDGHLVAGRLPGTGSRPRLVGTSRTYRGTHRATAADRNTSTVRSTAGDRAGARAGGAVTDPGPLGGSLLAPATWRQAWATATHQAERSTPFQDGGAA